MGFDINKSIQVTDLFILISSRMATHSSTLAWKTHGRRSLINCSPWGPTELDTTEAT